LLLEREFVQKTGPTGDPNCPPHISCAKLINRQLVQMIDGSTGGSDRCNSGEDESELEDALEDTRDLAECFEGVGQVEGLVGDGGEVWGEKLRGWLLLMGAVIMAAAVRVVWGVQATVWRASAGV
jgi:hypothetical protein